MLVEFNEFKEPPVVKGPKLPKEPLAVGENGWLKEVVSAVEEDGWPNEIPIDGAVVETPN